MDGDALLQLLRRISHVDDESIAKTMRGTNVGALIAQQQLHEMSASIAAKVAANLTAGTVNSRAFADVQKQLQAQLASISLAPLANVGGIQKNAFTAIASTSQPAFEFANMRAVKNAMALSHANSRAAIR
jgi:hypothetical protein